MLYSTYHFLRHGSRLNPSLRWYAINDIRYAYCAAHYLHSRLIVWFFMNPAIIMNRSNPSLSLTEDFEGHQQIDQTRK
jgi:hypothetical protein